MVRLINRPLALFAMIVAGPVLLTAAALVQLPKQLPEIEKGKHANYTEKIPETDVSFDMVAIPGGTFMMGSPKGEAGRQDDEGPQHPVKIRPFWMGKMEVSWDEYDLYWRKNAAKKEEPKTAADKAADAVTRPTPPYADETFGHGREGNPVLCISIHAAMEYCRWLSAKTGKLYRLPTEAEWEWACRAGTTTAFSFGDDSAKLDEFGWFDKNSDEVAHKIGKKKANAWGLFDMHGNVAEWCIDHYDKDYYGTLPLDKPSLSPFKAPSEKRYSYVARGGSWVDPPAMCRSAARRGSSKDWLKRDPQQPQSIWWMTDADFVGFRVVCPVEEQDNLKGLKSKITRESPD
ncbi:MAG TPA: formylglycine-generating enzyme family protein [Gemmataceae bacterium]|nr:formylglycine-generating enzyme family protein [Gemmataceae bacterium]